MWGRVFLPSGETALRWSEATCDHRLCGARRAGKLFGSGRRQLLPQQQQIIQEQRVQATRQDRVAKCIERIGQCRIEIARDVDQHHRLPIGALRTAA